MSSSLKDCPTGIPGFDEVTGGGFYRGQLILVVGNAGSGKTTFCAKFIYEGAKRYREPGLMLSTGESKQEFYAYMSKLGMDFKSLEKKGFFTYVELPTPTSTDTLMTLSEKLVSNATKLNAKRIVVDSITPVLMLNPPPEVRAVLHNALKTLTRALDATVLLTAEVPTGEERIGAEVEEFVVDGLIKLKLIIPEAGAPHRVMEISKLRGRPLGRTRYEYEIGPPHGLRILLTGVLEELSSAVDARNRLTVGVKGLDEMLGGGIVRGSTLLICGPTGSGKTLTCLSMAAENTLRGERVAYITFEEPVQQVEETLRFMGYNPEELREKGLKILSINPRAVTLVGTYNIADLLMRVGGDERTLVIMDGVATLREEFGRTFSRTLRDIAFFAKRNGVTMVFSVLKEPGEPITHVSTVADAIVEFRVKEVNGRLLRQVGVLKARMSEADPSFREVKLARGKLVVGG